MSSASFDERLDLAARYSYIAAKAPRLTTDQYVGLAQANAMMAIAGYLSEMHVCDHGTRGYCQPCVRADLA